MGIVGGTGPESTAIYYRMLIDGYRRSAPDAGDLPIVVTSIDGIALLRCLHQGAYGEVADALALEVERLHRAGAAVALFASSSVHVVFDEVRRRAPIPLLSIVEAATEEAARLHLASVCVLGTRFVTEGQFYPAAFAAAGIDVVTPSPSERAFLHGSYVQELLVGRVTDETVAGVWAVIDRAHRQAGADGVVLAGTELSLLAHRLDTELPVIDSTDVHVKAVLHWTARAFGHAP